LQCNKSKAFLEKALPFLIHSCEDESERVRVHALDSVGQLVRQSDCPIVFGMHDLETILRGLGDLSKDVRKSTYEFISAVHVDAVNTLDHVVKRLSGSIRAFPDDKIDIFRCAFSLGVNEKDKLRVMFKQLLGIQDGVMTREPEKENLQCALIISMHIHSFLYSHNYSLYVYICVYMCIYAYVCALDRSSRFDGFTSSFKVELSS
jgi:hypothetical protein